MPTQRPLFLRDEDLVYRAITKGLTADGRAKDKNFRLRPDEEGLSIALTPGKAIGTLDCKGYVFLTVGQIREIGLRVEQKGNDDDPDLLEIRGIPLNDTNAQQDYAIELANRASAPVLRRRPTPDR